MITTKQQQQARGYAASGEATDFETALIGLLLASHEDSARVIVKEWGHVIENMARKYDKNIVLLLTAEALNATRQRGHVMVTHSSTPLSSGREQYTYLCRNGNCCGYVQILPDPAPNQVNIGGTAVALECPVGDEYHWDITKRT